MLVSSSIGFTREASRGVCLTLLLLYLVSAMPACRADNPRFQGAENSTAQPAFPPNTSTSTNSDLQQVGPSTETQSEASTESANVSSSDQQGTLSPSSMPASSDSSDGATTTNSDTETSQPPTPPYCGTGPDLCYLIDDRPANGSLRNERGLTHALTVTPGHLEESLDRTEKGTRAVVLVKDGVAATSADTWQPPKEGFGFDLYLKLMDGASLPTVIFGLQGRLILTREAGGEIACAYNTDAGQVAYLSSGRWSNPNVDTWVHIICVYDGQHVSLWVNNNSPFKNTEVPRTSQTDGPRIPITIGGDLATPKGLVPGEYNSFQGSLSAIRIWSDMKALEERTGYHPQ